MIGGAPLPLAAAALCLVALGAAAQAEEPRTRVQEARRAMPAIPLRLHIGVSPKISTRPNSVEVSIEPRERTPDAAALYQKGLARLASDLVEGFAHIRVAAEHGDVRAISLFYSLGARLTAAEHAQAQHRAAEIAGRP